MNKISVTILNFNRPEFIYNNILPELITYNSFIDEVIISHGKEETYFSHTVEDINSKYKDIEFDIKHLKHWDLNETYGLSRRFLSANQSKNKYVLIMDDDIIPDKNTVKFLKKKIEKDDERIYGIYGRILDRKDEYTYTNIFGSVPIILTRCLITSKEMCQYFLDNFRNYENDLIKKSKPYWNGEDILFSLLSIKKFEKLPHAYDLKHYNRLGNYLNLNESISLGDTSHIVYRKNLTKYLVEELDIKSKIKEDGKVENWKTQIGYFVQNSSLIWIFSIIIVALLVFFIYKIV